MMANNLQHLQYNSWIYFRLKDHNRLYLFPIDVCTCVLIFMCVYLHVCVYIIDVYGYLFICVCLFLCVLYVYMYVNSFMYTINMYVYMYVHVFKCLERPYFHRHKLSWDTYRCRWFSFTMLSNLPREATLPMLLHCCQMLASAPILKKCT